MNNGSNIPQYVQPQMVPTILVSSKSRAIALVLAFFFGLIGVHRFYVGKAGTGVLMILTVGGFGLWCLIDFIMILVGSFTDKSGLFLKRW
jgi:TM2 domain-containing membrane protein YozV